MRDVATNKVVDALVEALAGDGKDSSYDIAVETLKNTLVKSMGPGGIKKDQEIGT